LFFQLLFILNLLLYPATHFERLIKALIILCLSSLFHIYFNIYSAFRESGFTTFPPRAISLLKACGCSGRNVIVLLLFTTAEHTKAFILIVCSSMVLKTFNGI